MEHKFYALTSRYTTLLLVFCFAFTYNASCQMIAVTEEGDTIYVYSDGTWSFELDKPFEPDDIFGGALDIELQIDTILEKQFFSKKADKEISTSIGQFDFKYENSIWKRVPPVEYNEDAEFAFEHRERDIWGILITEETEIGKENIFKIAIQSLEENLKTEVQIINCQSINVNGSDLLRGTFAMQISGIDFVFDNYYFSDERGTTQFSVWSSSNMWKKYESTVKDFMSGLIIK